MALEKSKIGIPHPQEHDVVSGRGDFANHHAGNQYFRAIVGKHKADYAKCQFRISKNQLAKMIVDEIKSRNPPGRFLKEDEATDLWYDIGEKNAVVKTMRALRHGAPELKKKMSSIQQNQQNIIGNGSVAGLATNLAFSAGRFQLSPVMNMQNQQNIIGNGSVAGKVPLRVTVESTGGGRIASTAKVKTNSVTMAPEKSKIGIPHPHEHDVVSGRGNFANHHAGNQHFRALVRKHKVDYVKCPKPQKGNFSKMIVDEIKSRNPPGRFLKHDEATDLWYDIGEKNALEKTRQALREGAPEFKKEMSSIQQNEQNIIGNGSVAGLATRTSLAFSAGRFQLPPVMNMQNQLNISRLIGTQNIMIGNAGVAGPGNLLSAPRQLLSPGMMMMMSPAMQQQLFANSLLLVGMNRGLANNNMGHNNTSQLPAPQVLAPPTTDEQTQSPDDDDEDDVHLDRDWDLNYQELAKFFKKHGHLRVEFGGSLYRWMHKQRKRRRGVKYTTPLSDKQIQLLDDIHFVWNPQRGRPKALYDKEWNTNYQELADFYKKHGHLRVESDSILYRWIVHQRVKRRGGKGSTPLSDKQIQLLDDIHFVWNPKQGRPKALDDNPKHGRPKTLDDKEWNTNYQELAEFYKKHGHLRVEFYGSLYHWIQKQRQRRRGVEGSTPLSDKQIQLLDEIGFSWNQLDAGDWNSKYQELVKFYKKHGHLRVEYKGTLHSWMSRQRLKRRGYERVGKPLTDEQIQLLDDLNFVWNPGKGNLGGFEEGGWMTMYQELAEFYKKHGNLRVECGSRLHRWVFTQRRRRRGSKGLKPLVDEQIQLLDDINFVWNLDKRDKGGRNDYRYPDRSKT